MYGQVYLITNKINGKRYVGQSVDPCRRWQDHKYGATKTSRKMLYNSMRKHGINNFSFEIIASAADPVSLTAAEQYFIFMYDTCNREHGYNRREAGCHGKFTPEARKRVSEWQRGRTLTEEHKRNIAKGGIGRQFSEESRRKISVARKGRRDNLGSCWSEEAKIRRRGHKKSLETRERMSAAQYRQSAAKTQRMLGDKNPFFGKKHSPEARLKMSLARKAHAERKRQQAQ